MPGVPFIPGQSPPGGPLTAGVGASSKPHGTHPDFNVVDAAAKAHGVPTWILWGVYGAESSWGKSSNWFGLVSIPRTGSFAGDANASAKALRKFYDENGHSWENALNVYNSGHVGSGYGLAHIRALYNQSPGRTVHVGPDVPAAVGNVLSGIDAIGHFFSDLTNPKLWIQILEVLAGLVLLFFGVDLAVKAGFGSGIKP